MSTAAIPKSEKEWQAEDDAYSLARAQEIKNDPARHKAAQGAAKRLVSEQTERTRALGQVAGKKQSGSLLRAATSAPKTPTGGKGNVPRSFA